MDKALLKKTLTGIITNPIIIGIAAGLLWSALKLPMPVILQDVYKRQNPTRIVTSTVRVSGGDADMVSVKTKEDIPKGKIFECVKALKSVEVPAPVHIGDVLVKNVAGTGVDIVATKNVESI